MKVQKFKTVTKTWLRIKNEWAFVEKSFARTNDVI